MRDFDLAIENLNSLAIDNLHSMESVERWLLSYRIIYHDLKKDFFCKNSQTKLPCFCEKIRLDCLFLEIYESLEKVWIDFKFEEYFQIEMAIYYEIKDDINLLKKWLMKQEDFGLYRFVSFYDEMEYKSIVLPIRNFKIIIDGFDFKNIVRFGRVFKLHFFEDQLLPERYVLWKNKVGFVD